MYLEFIKVTNEHCKFKEFKNRLFYIHECLGHLSPKYRKWTMLD